MDFDWANEGPVLVLLLIRVLGMWILEVIVQKIVFMTRSSFQISYLVIWALVQIRTNQICLFHNHIYFK